MSIPSTGQLLRLHRGERHDSGRVFSKSYGRRCTRSGLAARAPAIAATLRDSIEITWK